VIDLRRRDQRHAGRFEMAAHRQGNCRGRIGAGYVQHSSQLGAVIADAGGYDAHRRRQHPLVQGAEALANGLHASVGVDLLPELAIEAQRGGAIDRILETAAQRVRQLGGDGRVLIALVRQVLHLVLGDLLDQEGNPLDFVEARVADRYRQQLGNGHLFFPHIARRESQVDAQRRGGIRQRLLGVEVDRERRRQLLAP
jgi:hypothetical protein